MDGSFPPPSTTPSSADAGAIGAVVLVQRATAPHFVHGKGLEQSQKQTSSVETETGRSQAKKAAEEAGSADDTNAKELQKLSDEEIQERNDRLRFEELLKKGSANVFNDYSSGGYLNKQQEEEEIDAYRKCVRCSATALIESSYQVLKQIKKY